MVAVRYSLVNIYHMIYINQEDERLKKAIEKVGLGKWSQVSQMLHPRTDNQCWRRWKMLNAQDVEQYRRVIYKKKKVKKNVVLVVVNLLLATIGCCSRKKEILTTVVSTGPGQ